MIKLPSKVAYFSIIEEKFAITGLTVQIDQTLKFLISNVAYTATAQVCHQHWHIQLLTYPG